MFRVGIAQDENALYELFKDFITGVGSLGSVDYTGSVGNGIVSNIQFKGTSYTDENFYTLEYQSGSGKEVNFTVKDKTATIIGNVDTNQVFDRPEIQFYFESGSVDFQVGDTLIINTMARPVGIVAPKADIQNIVPKITSLTETITITCTTAGIEEDLAALPTPIIYEPAVFQVLGSASGLRPDMTQGTPYVDDSIDFEIPNPGDITDPAAMFQIGDQITLEVTQNDLTGAAWEWEHVESDLTYTAEPYFGGQNITGDRRATFKGQGFAGLDEIFISLERIWDVPSAWANWRFTGLAGYNPALAWVDQPKNMYDAWGREDDYYPVHQFWNDEVTYWIVATGRSVRIATKSNNSYHQSYFGLYIPWASPVYEPYPLAIGGSSWGAYPDPALIPYQMSPFWNPKSLATTQSDFQWRSPMKIMGRDGDVLGFVNYESNSPQELQDDTAVHVTVDQCVYPYNNNAMKAFRRGIDGSMPLLRVMLGNNLGEMEGVYGIPGMSAGVETAIQPEDLIIDDADRKYVAFINHTRTDNDDYVAVELV